MVRYQNKNLQRMSELELIAFEIESLSHSARALDCALSADRLMAVADQVSSEAAFLWDTRPGAPQGLTKAFPAGVKA